MSYLVLLIGILIIAFLLHRVKAQPFGLVTQDAEITPVVAQIGEVVSVDMTIKNVGNDTTSCNVTAFCGDCVVGVQEISTIVPKASAPLSFKLNTSNLTTGIYSIEVLIEKPSGQQKIYDLGAITIEQDDLTTSEDVTEPQPDSPSPVAIAYWQCLLPAVPAGVTASALILRKRRKKSQEPAIPGGQLPYLFNEILKFEDMVETGTGNTISQEKKYIC